jgi:hypothetical protein
VRAELSWRGRTGTVTVDGVDLARLHRVALRERARAELAGSSWSLASHRGAIIATGPGGSPQHTARGEGLLSRRWSLDLGGSRVLRMDAAGSRGWRLVDMATGAEVGVVRARGLVSQRVEAQLPADTALDALVFVLWVADVRARRQAAVVTGR